MGCGVWGWGVEGDLVAILDRALVAQLPGSGFGVWGLGLGIWG